MQKRKVAFRARDSNNVGDGCMKFAGRWIVDRFILLGHRQLNLKATTCVIEQHIDEAGGRAGERASERTNVKQKYSRIRRLLAQEYSFPMISM